MACRRAKGYDRDRSGGRSGARSCRAIWRYRIIATIGYVWALPRRNWPMAAVTGSSTPWSCGAMPIRSSAACASILRPAPPMSACSRSMPTAISPPVTACWLRSPIRESSEQIGDRVAVAAHGIDVVGHAPAGHALVVIAAKRVVQRDMRDAGFLPEADFLTPVLFGAGAGRGPDFEANRGRIASFGFHQAAQLVEFRDGLGSRRFRQHHPAVAPFCDPLQRHVHVTAEPQRNLALWRPGIDAGVRKAVPLALERNVGIGPQRFHHLDLFLGPLASVVEILVEADEFHLVPAHADAEPEAAAAEYVETGGLLGNQHSLTLREDQHLGGKFDLFRAGSDEAERHEGVMEQSKPTRTATGGVGWVAAQHVIRQRQTVVTFGLGELSEFAHDRAIATDVAERQGYSEMHGRFLAVAGCRFPTSL